jgi:hypothetical protein
MLPDYFGSNVMQTVSEAALARYKDKTYDCALPQSWVDACYERGFEVRGNFVWLYDNFCGRPAPITEEGERICSILAGCIE